MSATVIAVANHKGGVAKTTCVINLADVFSRAGLRVLVIDVDPQSNATQALLSDTHGQVADPSVRELLISNDLSMALRVVREDTTIDGVHLIPANVKLVGIEESLRNNFTPASVLRDRIRCLVEKTDIYDIVLIDTPPALSLMTANALTAAHHVLIPIESGNRFALYGLDDLDSYIARIRPINPGLNVLGAVLTKHDGRRTVCQVTEQASREAYFVFDSTISNATAVQKSQVYGKSALQFDRRAPVSREFVKLGSQILERIGISVKKPADADDDDGERNAA